MHANRLHVSIVAAVAVLAGGCGGNGGGSASDCPPAGVGTEARQTDAAGTDITYLTALMVEPATCGDRVVFEFRDRIPRAKVEYRPREDALVEDGSGDAVDAEGEAFLVVRLEPAATAESDGDELEFTYTGPRRLEPEGAEFVREVVKTGDFEAVVTWVIGVTEERPFRVTSSGTGITVEIV